MKLAPTSARMIPSRNAAAGGRIRLAPMARRLPSHFVPYVGGMVIVPNVVGLQGLSIGAVTADGVYAAVFVEGQGAGLQRPG